jgi:transcriptional regulator with XRE-family HTH domain
VENVVSKSIFSHSYDRFRKLLVEARCAQGLTQLEVAKRLRRPQSFVSKYERGERRLDVVEFLEVSDALGVDPANLIAQLQERPCRPAEPVSTSGVLERWQVSSDELAHTVDANPSLRGMLLGYIAELKLSQLLEAHPGISASVKYDDHDRAHKGDRVVTFRKHQFIIESKSLQTNTIRREEARWVGKAQVDASDRRMVKLPDGTQLNTTLLLAGQFDILAVNLFAFENTWRFVFAKNADLPRSTFRKYTRKQRKYLIASLITVTWPPEPPFHEDLFELLKELVRERGT